ncbi:anti-sigma factor [Nocardia sp. NPDC005978]|uniref:ATP-binding protein n=1 Tax=Nocardia sp. NPDC005978 TaxID=3156725 RepID=UPI0033AF8827
MGNSRSRRGTAGAHLRVAPEPPQPAPPPTPNYTEVAVRTPAVAGQLGTLRALAETVCLIADFGIDTAVDLRIAVDEVASALVRAAVPGTEIDCRFHCDDYSMGVHIHGVIDALSGFETDGVGWHMLRSLTDGVHVTTEPFDRALSGFPIAVRFSRTRGQLADQAPGPWTTRGEAGRS